MVITSLQRHVTVKVCTGWQLLCNLYWKSLLNKKKKTTEIQTADKDLPLGGLAYCRGGVCMLEQPPLKHHTLWGRGAVDKIIGSVGHLLRRCYQVWTFTVRKDRDKACGLQIQNATRQSSWMRIHHFESFFQFDSLGAVQSYTEWILCQALGKKTGFLHSSPHRTRCHTSSFFIWWAQGMLCEVKRNFLCHSGPARLKALNPQPQMQSNHINSQAAQKQITVPEHLIGSHFV